MKFHCVNCEKYGDAGCSEYLAKRDKEIEKLAEQLHTWYLQATKKLNPKSYNQKAQVPYISLSEDQKEIDRYIAKRIIDNRQD